LYCISIFDNLLNNLYNYQIYLFLFLFILFAQRLDITTKVYFGKESYIPSKKLALAS